MLMNTMTTMRTQNQCNTPMNGLQVPKYLIMATNDQISRNNNMDLSNQITTYQTRTANKTIGTAYVKSNYDERNILNFQDYRQP